jgi:photosystem II stability/assembly factor-like uncharacterized protein
VSLALVSAVAVALLVGAVLLHRAATPAAAQPREGPAVVVGTVVDRGPQHIAVRSDETREVFEFLVRENPDLIRRLQSVRPGQRVEAVGHREGDAWVLAELHMLGGEPGPPPEGPERPETPPEPIPPDERPPGEGPAAYRQDFEGGTEGWELDPGWELLRPRRGSRSLRGRGHTWARYVRGAWGDYELALRLRLARGAIHLNYRVEGPRRYFIGVDADGVRLAKQTGPETFFNNLASGERRMPADRFVPIRIAGRGGRIQVRVAGQVLIDYTDRDPLLRGGIAFETLDGSEAYVDDVTVTGSGAAVAAPGAGAPQPLTGPLPPGGLPVVQVVTLPTGPVAALPKIRPAMPPMRDLTNIQRALRWQYTGGPVGGLGYDVRMVQGQPTTMYVSDAWAGVFRSNNGGQGWTPMNEGITVRRGLTNEAFPIFSLTISPHNPNVIWIGTKDNRGIFRSDDGGQQWHKMDKNLPFNGKLGLTVRGFTVHPTKPNTVFAAAEISSFAWHPSKSKVQGKDFDKTRGVVYRTDDNGQTWHVAWQGDNLARYILIDPRNPDVMYISTGIFDREAANASATTPGGVGIYKTTTGGKNPKTDWYQINNGLGNLYVGSLFMHPQNPDILLAGTGCNPWLKGAGVYISPNGGASWQWTLQSQNSAITAVEFAASDPKIAYAGSSEAIFRSHDTGMTWHRMTPPGKVWGPDGIRAGWPIDFQVDPKNANRLFANAYGGGNFLTTDGGVTWTNASKGYSGAQMRHLVVDPADGRRVYAAGRSGLFVTRDAGRQWLGLNNEGGQAIDWPMVAIHPTNSQHIIGASLWNPKLLRTVNGGQSWQAMASLPSNAYGWRCAAFARSNPARVYAGTAGRATFGQLDTTLPGLGIYTSPDGAKTWFPANDPTSKDAHVFELLVDPDKAYIVYAATYNHGVLMTDNNGQKWQQRNPTPKQVKNPKAISLAMHPATTKTLYLGLEHAGLYRTVDGGVTWKPWMAGIDPNASISEIVFDPAEPRIMYASDLKSGVYRWDEAKKVWRKINLGLWNREVNAMAISGDGKMLYAGSEGAGVFRLDMSGT